MSAKQGHNRNQIRRVCLYAILSAVCLSLGYLESLVPLTFIAPGVKIGLANTVCLILAAKMDIKGAFFVNTVRILLSGLLFGSIISLSFSLTAGVISLGSVCILRRLKVFSLIGVSTIAAVVHNLVQMAVAVCIMGVGSLYYLPVLIISGIFSGLVVGIISDIILKKVKTNGNK